VADALAAVEPALVGADFAQREQHQADPLVHIGVDFAPHV